MAPTRLSFEVLKSMLEAVDQYGGVATAARELGIAEGTMKSRIARARAVANGAVLVRKQGFEINNPPSAELSAEELIERRSADYHRKHEAAEARRLVTVHIKTDGPIGIAHFGDPHVDDDGCNIGLIQRHLKIVNRTEGLFGANVGDYSNNWIGRLARLWAEQSTSAEEARTLVKWLIKSTDWLYLVGGNHDAWSGTGDPVRWISEQDGQPYQMFAARMELIFPNGRKIRVNARHDFKGHSEWNTAHGPAKAARIGWRDHILTCGHKHISGYNVLKDPATGLLSHAIRVASYKLHDRFAVEQGLPDQNIFVCPVTIIDPTRADDDPGCVTTIFDPEMGADFLTFLRKRGRYAAPSPRRSARPARRRSARR